MTRRRVDASVPDQRRKKSMIPRAKAVGFGHAWKTRELSSMRSNTRVVAIRSEITSSALVIMASTNFLKSAESANQP